MKKSSKALTHCVTKTVIDRAIRDEIHKQLGMPNKEIRKVLAPMVYDHLQKIKKEREAVRIAKKMLLSGELKLTVKDGVVKQKKAKPHPKSKKKERQGPTEAELREDPAFLRDANNLMDVLRRAILEQNLSHKEVAKSLKVSTSTIKNWTTLLNMIPANRNLSTIAQFLRSKDYSDVPARFH